MTTRRGYLFALAALVVGFAISGVMLWRLSTRVDAMPRVEMPGKQAVTLSAGETIAFAERAAGEVGALRVSARCAAVDTTGAKIELSTPSTRTSYTFGSREGSSMFELQVATAGPVTVTCESDGRFVLAFGDGLGRGIALTVVAGFAGFGVALFLGLRTWRRRRRERKQATAASAA